MTLLSRITGLLRETLKATVFGAGLQMDAFEAAFRLPNLLRRLFGEGAFSQAFVPILAEYRRKRGLDATRSLVGNVSTLLAVVLIALSVLGSLAAPWLVYVLAGGFSRTPGKVELTAEMIRIVFPYILFVSLVSLAGGVLNVFRRFAIPAFTPVLLNVSIIAAAILLARFVDPPIVALAIGVAIGGVAQLALPLVSTLYQYGRFTINDVMQTRAALLGYSLGLPAIILVKILAPGFYARQVMKTPVKIASFTVVVTQTLAVIFAWPLGLEQAGLTLAMSIGACCNAGLLLWLLLRKRFYEPQPGWPAFFAKVCVASAVLAVVIVWLMGGDSAWLHAGALRKVAHLALVIGCAALAYFATLFALGFRLADFNRREAVQSPDHVPAETGDTPE
jgi:peptidoglycan biosynthesis protein MviN/MurJ (putative lipid II flippase)